MQGGFTWNASTRRNGNGSATERIGGTERLKRAMQGHINSMADHSGAYKPSCPACRDLRRRIEAFK